MNYYSLTNQEGKEKLVAIPSAEYLWMAMTLAFRKREQNLPFHYNEDGTFTLDKDFTIPVMKATEISQEEFRQQTQATTWEDSYFAQFDCIFDGEELPENWHEKSMNILSGSSWVNEFGWEDDLAKFVDGEIDSENMCIMFWKHMSDIDPVLELEANDRWLYGSALKAEQEAKEAQEATPKTETFTFLVECKYKVWERHTVEIEATSYEEAKARVINIAANNPVGMTDNEPGIEVSFETLNETEELVDPQEDGAATIQVMTPGKVSDREILYENY